MFAVIKTGGKQYKVATDDILEIEKLDANPGDAVIFDNVLMLGTGADVTIGAPLVEGATVAAELVEQARAKKIIVFKKKRRQKYRRKAGHRQDLSVVRITEILTDGKKPAAKKAAPKKDAAEKTDTAAAKAKPAGKIADDLKLIAGVGPVLEKKLNDLGVTSLKQVAEFTPEDIARIDEALSFKGRIDREGWIEQAKGFLAGENQDK
ncbi:LSU ribosomal protein L21p [hydrothermal vent metagenome]|uniref:LSU ribosomal protein L21p n=1 Tax=hydrothermal vent metagenome TaxID=652676 RepID=A0A3B0UCG2_9ZZZZ